jgi:hypothetical protein
MVKKKRQNKLLISKKRKDNVILKIWEWVSSYLFAKNVSFKKIACSYCSLKNAVWINTIVEDYACDECIPRGCSCVMYPKDGNENNLSISNWDYKKDDEGNELPCEDWRKLTKKDLIK